jgi:hypothetical protein
MRSLEIARLGNPLDGERDAQRQKQHSVSLP